MSYGPYHPYEIQDRENFTSRFMEADVAFYVGLLPNGAYDGDCVHVWNRRDFDEGSSIDQNMRSGIARKSQWGPRVVRVVVAVNIADLPAPTPRYRPANIAA